MAISVLIATGVHNVSFVGLEFRFARGAGVVLNDCEQVVLDGCTVADNGYVGVVAVQTYC